MLKAATTRRFNYIDVATALSSGMAAANKLFVLWFFILVAGVIVSVVAECFVKDMEGAE